MVYKKAYGTMISTIIIVAGVLASIALIIYAFGARKAPSPNKYMNNDKWLVKASKRGNIVVAGEKGHGKDLLQQHIINLRGEPYYANISYGGDYEQIDIGELNLGENTFQNLIDGTVVKIKNPRFIDGQDVYISDIGAILPSQYNDLLDKRYPSMPMFFALSRQLHRMNIHSNLQTFERLWNKLREQGDTYIYVAGNTDYGDYIEVETISYSRYKSAINGMQPLEVASPAQLAKYKAQYGDIVRRNFKIYKKDLHYDTYHFKGVFYEVPEETDILSEVIKNV